MKPPLLSLGAILALALCGCASSNVVATTDRPAQTERTPTGVSPLWQTDWQATLELVRAAEPEDADYFTLDNLDREEGVFEVILELGPDGDFIMSLRAAADVYEASGSYRVYPGDRGQLVRLDPDEMLGPNPTGLFAIVRSMVIEVDPNGDRAIIQSLTKFDTVLRSMN